MVTKKGSGFQWGCDTWYWLRIWSTDLQNVLHKVSYWSLYSAPAFT